MVMLVVTPVAAVLATMLIGMLVFDLIGIDGLRAVTDIFLTPLLASYKWQDVAVKAAPLIIIALGLSVANRAQVWNIGAEGQYIIGALGATGIGLAFGQIGGPVVVALMLVAIFSSAADWVFFCSDAPSFTNVSKTLVPSAWAREKAPMPASQICWAESFTWPASAPSSRRALEVVCFSAICLSFLTMVCFLGLLSGVTLKQSARCRQL